MQTIIDAIADPAQPSKDAVPVRRVDLRRGIGDVDLVVDPRADLEVVALGPQRHVVLDDERRVLRDYMARLRKLATAPDVSLVDVERSLADFLRGQKRIEASTAAEIKYHFTTFETGNGTRITATQPHIGALRYLVEILLAITQPCRYQGIDLDIVRYPAAGTGLTTTAAVVTRLGDLAVGRTHTLPDFIQTRGGVSLRPGDGIIHSWLNRMLLPDTVGTGGDSHTRFPMGISFPAGSP